MRKILLRSFRLLSVAFALLPFELQAAEPVALNAAPLVADSPNRGVHLDEISIGTGYAWGELKHTRTSFRAYPAFVRFGFDMNSVFGMKQSKGTLQLAIEPFANPVTKPESGVEAGLGIFIRYLHPLSSSVKLVSEVGSGPMYLGINTREQGKKGFNFMNQFGAGLQMAVTESSALTLGYRFRHLSNAGISEPNRGINTGAVVISYSMLY
ncbi:MAG: acyloxyacyl hydrolase [Chlorobiaceae bacterium]|nr:acyloxyacyl hydrolase [Chlorobiaceae bacterium]